MSLPSIRTQIFLIVLCMLSITGCESIQYYGQAIHGQVSILNKRRPIDRLLADPETPEKLKEKLRLVLQIRDFADNELHLPVNGNYLSYVEIKRPAVVWNVFAAPEFSLTPKTWCFPIVGCTAYRGYFSEKKAQAYAEKQKKIGLDVFIGPVLAYSTLGWFDDPILSTVINRSESGLAALIFHELAHQILYVDDDTAFNESFATTVEQEGLRRFMSATHKDQAFSDYLGSYQRQLAFRALVMNYRNKLDILYNKHISLDEKRSQKALIIEALRKEYQHQKLLWQGYAGYDRWFKAPINNAKMNTVSTYHELGPAFQNFLQYYEGNLTQFYKACQKLAKKSKVARLRELKMKPTGKTARADRRNAQKKGAK